MKHKLQISISIFIILLTIAAFAFYLNRHYYLVKQILHTPPLTIIGLFLLYTVLFASLVFIMQSSLRICKKTLGIKENFLLNAYSSLVNFFIPGQGGIAIRGIYLKRIKKLAYRNFLFATLIYYMFYAIISTLLLFANSKVWWLAVVAALIVAFACMGIIHFYKKRYKTSEAELDASPIHLFLLFSATLFQTIIQIIIYMVELHSVNSHISLRQTITYTGAANFALFVALTPGAIGIRESFLLLTRRLHHISSSNIVAANVIDRAVFIIFLGILFLVTIGFHAKYKDILKSPKIEKNVGIS